MDATVRIVYDGTIYTSQATGGISRYYTRLIEEMATLRPAWQFDLHILDDGRAPAQLPVGRNIRITRRKYFRPGWCCLPLNYGCRRYHIQKSRPSILHTTLARPLHWSPCPLITTIHDAIIEKLPEFYSDKRHARSKRWWRWSAAHADAVLTVSNTSRADIVETWSTAESKVHVTYPGVNEAFCPPRPEEVLSALAAFRVTRPYVLYVGHRGEHKNFQVLAEAMTIPILSGFDLVLVGGADPDESLIARLDPGQKRLHHLSGVTDGQLCALYAGAVALVFPSLYEGFGFPLVEAMSCGAPVVASDIPSSREVCDDAAEFFPPRDSGGCAQSILRAAGNERRDVMIRKGLERASLFSWTSCAKKTIEVYEEVLLRQQA